jgi:hypothetical protein
MEIIMTNGKDGQVENVKNEHYAAMPDSWQARNNKETNIAMGYNNMSDMANTPHPATQMKGEKRNVQLSPQMPGEDKFNYDKNR